MKNGNIKKRESKLSKGIKHIFSKNPLWYLGWLGILGVIGLLFVPSLIPFLFFFTFFAYGSMTPDELFWNQVRCASTKAFWTVFFTDIVGMLGIVCRAMFFRSMEYKAGVVETGLIEMDLFTWEQNFLLIGLFLLNQTLMVIVFSVCMLKYRKQEKKALKEQEELA